MADPGVPENGRARLWGDAIQRSARHPTMPHEEGALRADIVAFATVATWPSHRGATGAIRLGSEQQAPRADSAARGADLSYQASEKAASGVKTASASDTAGEAQSCLVPQLGGVRYLYAGSQRGQ